MFTELNELTKQGYDLQFGVNVLGQSSQLFRIVSFLDSNFHAR